MATLLVASLLAAQAGAQQSAPGAQRETQAEPPGNTTESASPPAASAAAAGGPSTGNTSAAPAAPGPSVPHPLLQGAAAPDRPIAGDGVALAGPDTFILVDEQGRPRTFLNMQYEDFVNAWRQLQSLPAARAAPRFSLEEMRIQGTAADAVAHLRVELTVLLLTAEPVAVPLGFSGAVLNRAAAQEEETEESVTHFTYAASQGGLVAWLDGESGQRRSLQLELAVPLERSGDEIILRLNCPRAVTSSLALDVPAPLQPAVTSDGTSLEQRPLGEAGTRLVVGGLAGQYQLSWQSARSEPAELATVLSAGGSLMVTIDGRSVHTEALLTVQSFGGSFDSFRVRLPPGANLRESGQEFR